MSRTQLSNEKVRGRRNLRPCVTYTAKGSIAKETQAHHINKCKYGTFSLIQIILKPNDNYNIIFIILILYL